METNCLPDEAGTLRTGVEDFNHYATLLPSTDFNIFKQTIIKGLGPICSDYFHIFTCTVKGTEKLLDFTKRL